MVGIPGSVRHPSVSRRFAICRLKSIPGIRVQRDRRGRGVKKDVIELFLDLALIGTWQLAGKHVTTGLIAACLHVKFAVTGDAFEGKR